MLSIDADRLNVLINADALIEWLSIVPLENGMINPDVVVEFIREMPNCDGWISVKDRLPERYERILTYDKYHGVRENWLLQSYPCVSWSYGFHVTHWMPMPEPPKETT